MGHTSSKGPCFIAMLVHPNVYIISYHTKAILDVGRKRRGGPGTGVTGTILETTQQKPWMER